MATQIAIAEVFGLTAYVAEADNPMTEIDVAFQELRNAWCQHRETFPESIQRDVGMTLQELDVKLGQLGRACNPEWWDIGDIIG